MRRGEVYENEVTGERIVVRLGSSETGGRRLQADMYLRPGAAVVGEHRHPAIRERFTIVRGEIGFLLDGRRSTAEAGQTVEVPPGMWHDWWNAGDGEAHVVVEIEPGARMEELMLNGFGLAADGKTNARGMPSLLQVALWIREFDDVIRFRRPPRPVQRLLSALLAPIGRLRGYRGSYPEYLTRGPVDVVPLDDDTAVHPLPESHR